MVYDVMADWITEAGFRAVVIQVKGRHTCGYVGVPEGHSAYGKHYSDPVDFIKQEQVDSVTLGTKSPILALSSCVRSDEEGEKIRRSLDVLIDVHGGLTYSSGEKRDKYPVESDLWWFGFDTAHSGDPEGGMPLDYCKSECERMATQFAQINPSF